MASSTSYTEETCEDAVGCIVDHVYRSSESLLIRCKILENFNLLFSLLLFHLWAGLIDKLTLDAPQHHAFSIANDFISQPNEPRTKKSEVTEFLMCNVFSKFCFNRRATRRRRRRYWEADRTKWASRARNPLQSASLST